MFHIFNYFKYFKCFRYSKVRSGASQRCTRAANALLTPNQQIFYPSATPTTSSLLCNPAWMVIFAGAIRKVFFLSQTLEILSESTMNMRNKTELECPFRILFRRTPHWENCKTHSHFPTRSQLGLRVTWSWIEPDKNPPQWQSRQSCVHGRIFCYWMVIQDSSWNDP